MDTISSTTGDLGPRQIQWLRDHIPTFDRAWISVQQADANAERVRRELRERMKQ